MIDIRTDHEAYREMCIAAIGDDIFAPAALALKNIIDKMNWFHNAQVVYHDRTRDPIVSFLAEVRGATWTVNDQDDPALTPENKLFLNSIREVRQSVYDEFFFRLPIVQSILAEINEHRQAEARERDSKIEVYGDKYDVLKKIDVLWSGWECDASAWVVQTDEGKKLVMSNHGSNYFAAHAELQSRINEYQKAIDESLEMLEMLKMCP